MCASQGLGHVSHYLGLYDPMLSWLRQCSHRHNLRHLKALGWMVTALVCGGTLSLPAWEPSVPSRARQAQITEQRWQGFRAIVGGGGWSIPALPTVISANAAISPATTTKDRCRYEARQPRVCLSLHLV
ncbi:MAG: hypothetical protein ACHWZW_09080 [Spirulina sp.]